MKDYEFEENGRILCKRHGLIRCSECQEIDDLYKGNQRYKKALKAIKEPSSRPDHTELTLVKWMAERALEGEE